MDTSLNRTGSDQTSGTFAQRPRTSLGLPSARDVDAFLAGVAPGPRGLRLSELLAKDDAFFEACHDFVQWLFPLNTPSAYHPFAPVLSVEELAGLSAAARLGTEAAFERMLGFYGLRYEPICEPTQEPAHDGGRVFAGANWDVRMRDWAITTTHNSLRLTRVLRSLTMQGHTTRALALLAFLRGLFADHLVSSQRREELAYWKQAVSHPAANGLL